MHPAQTRRLQIALVEIGVEDRDVHGLERLRDAGRVLGRGADDPAGANPASNWS